MTSEIHCDSLWHGADVVTMRDGAVRDLRSGDITVADESTDGTKIQTCVSAVAGRCDIEL